MSSKISLNEQLYAFKEGVILDADGTASECFNFFDWFCKDSSLKNKAKRLFPVVRKFVKLHPEIDTSSVYVVFKNNCPMFGPLYDDFRICDMESGEVIWCVSPKDRLGNFSAYSSSNGFKDPTYLGRNMTEAMKYEPTFVK